jgi:hypothetical protein
MVHEPSCEVIAKKFQFTTPEVAKAAGFRNIREMREAFHNRAKVIHENQVPFLHCVFYCY